MLSSEGVYFTARSVLDRERNGDREKSDRNECGVVPPSGGCTL